MDYIRECGIGFLDINMDGMDSMDAARELEEAGAKMKARVLTHYCIISSVCENRYL
ncbi:MAG: hypothetical protein K2L82_15725 [Lachnospiraceae bacterium]|nr:hypothetical protein [Lachnospiraceae bacterium]